VRQLLRLLKIIFTIWRFGLLRIVRDSLKPGIIKLILSALSWTTPGSYTRGESLRLALEALGPIFIKFGQVLSTRRDLLPTDIADELAKLQFNKMDLNEIAIDIEAQVKVPDKNMIENKFDLILNIYRMVLLIHYQ
jgi:predicted unusual protein kinase regulating ubiquinone biosynthesis (AarF/ABC1/UbiB family)